MEKKELRKLVRTFKQKYNDPQKRTEWSEKLLEQVEADETFSKAHTVLLYCSLPDEVETQYFVDKWSRHKEVLLPVVVGDDLELRRYTGRKDLSTGSFNIKEPTGELFTDYDKIEFVLVPGMAFDARGNRLGRGKGYYDRLLPRLKNALKCGLCYPFQLMEEVPAEEYDIKMDKVICKTEL